MAAGTVRGKLFSALAVLLGLGACGSSDDRPHPKEIIIGDAYSGEFDLIDHHGEPAPDERFEGKTVFIYYGFTSCPLACPPALGRMTNALDRLGRRQNDVQALFITIDPERDTTSRLSDHLAYDDRLLGLTGDDEAISDALAAMRVYAQRVETPDSALAYTMDHTSLFYVLDSTGTPVRALRDDMDPEDIATILREFLP